MAMTDVVVIGGGLAGLTNAILLSRAGLSVRLFEKKNYPFHRVCGEYVSNEVVPFLKRNELYPDHILPTSIRKLLLTSTNGNSAQLELDMGGFGISRYAFDYFLYQQAEKSGVEFFLNTSVESVCFSDDSFEIKVGGKEYRSKLVIGAFGKRSNLDKKLERKGIDQRSPYLAVKYHIKTDFPSDTIALHNFKDGYCGMSQVENDTYNLCYLSHRSNLKKHGNITEMEKEVLCKNPFLKEIFSNSDFLFDKPHVINEISFIKKKAVENHVLMSGDATGMIAPLCGNGMAMAIHSAKILSETILANKNNGEFDRENIEQAYAKLWQSQFNFRLWAGRNIQHLFGAEFASNLAVGLAKAKPIANTLVRMTHGKEF